MTVSPGLNLRGVLTGKRSLGRYAVIGASGTIIDIAVYSLLIFLGLQGALATLVSTPLALLNNYFWNSKLNFYLDVRVSRGAKYFSVGLFGILLSSLLIYTFSILGSGDQTAKLISIPIVVLLQVCANFLWTFRIKRTEVHSGLLAGEQD